MNEVELKFQVPPDRRDALRATLAARGAVPVSLHARYVDTADGLLARHGVSLRVRREGDAWVQTLKTPGAGAIDRREHNVPLDAPARGDPRPDIARHAGTPAHARLMKVLGRAPGPAGGVVLQEVFRTDVVQHVLALPHGPASVEVAFDVGHVAAADRTQDIAELEFELKRGDPSDLVAAALPWVADFGLWLDVVSKGERGHLLARDSAHAASTRASAPDVVRAEPRRFVRDTVAACLDQVLRNGSEVARGSPDPDHVHQLRVGLRRLRTALRELPQLNAGLDPAWEAPLAHAFRELGRHRDQTLLETGTGKALAAAGAPRMRHATVHGPAIVPAELVRAWALQSTLLALLAFSMTPVGPDATAFDGDALAAIGERLDQLQRRLRKSARQFAAMSPDDQHAVRKRLKRLRYLAEFIAPAWRRSRVSAYFDRLKPAQDDLGEHNDEATALAHYRERTSEDPHAWFAVGWLTARQRVSARAAAKALRAAGRARPFWRDPPKKKRSR